MRRNSTIFSIGTSRASLIFIDILFEKENIHSMSGDGELMLSILASFAQEESLSVSENCKWRIRRDFAAGEGNSFDMYGYKIRGGEYEIVPEEADVVRQIYSWYLDGVGTGRIAIELNLKQIQPCRGTAWNRTTIMSVLRNEKYTGNILLQKTFISDHLTKAKRKNMGELPQYYVEGSHECCPYVNTNAPPQKARKMGVSWDMCFAHPSSQMAKRLHIGEL